MVQDVYLGIGAYILDFYYQPRKPGDIESTNRIDYGIADIAESYVTGALRNGWANVELNFNVLTEGVYSVFFSAGGRVDTLGGFIDNVSLEAAPVPEPSTLLLGGGLAGLAFYRRKRK